MRSNKAAGRPSTASSHEGTFGNCEMETKRQPLEWRVSGASWPVRLIRPAGQSAGGLPLALGPRSTRSSLGPNPCEFQ